LQMYKAEPELLNSLERFVKDELPKLKEAHNAVLNDGIGPPQVRSAVGWVPRECTGSEGNKCPVIGRVSLPACGASCGVASSPSHVRWCLGGMCRAGCSG
jgi:hypothetical protein